MNESIIYKKLNDFFKPDLLQVINDSHKHKDMQVVQIQETHTFRSLSSLINYL